MENSNATENDTNDTKPPGNTGGAGADGGNGNESDAPDLATFNRFKNDMNRWKDEARKNADELKKLKDQDLKEKENWKEFAQAKEKEADDWKTKYNTQNNAILERAKVSKVREEALKLGLVETAVDDLETLELKDVIVEFTSTGRTSVIGAKAAAERIKSIRPHWFSENKVPNVNGSMPQVKPGQVGKVTFEELDRLQKAAKESGDYKEYQKKMMEFKTQR